MIRKIIAVIAGIYIFPLLGFPALILCLLGPALPIIGIVQFILFVSTGSMYQESMTTLGQGIDIVAACFPAGALLFGIGDLCRRGFLRYFRWCVRVFSR